MSNHSEKPAFRRYVKQPPEILVGPKFTGHIEPFLSLNWKALGFDLKGISACDGSLAITYSRRNDICSDRHTVVLDHGQSLGIKNDHLTTVNSGDLVGYAPISKAKYHFDGNGVVFTSEEWPPSVVTGPSKKQGAGFLDALEYSLAKGPRIHIKPTPSMPDKFYEALGWMHAECCAALDRGEDPRSFEVPEMVSRCIRDLSAE